MQSPPFPRYLVPPRSKYSPQHHILKQVTTNKLVVIINCLKVPKIKKILPYEMKFLVPNYSCLQNPWLGGYRPQTPVLSVLNWICWTPPPPPNKIPGYATAVGGQRQAPAAFTSGTQSIQGWMDHSRSGPVSLNQQLALWCPRIHLKYGKKSKSFLAKEEAERRSNFKSWWASYLWWHALHYELILL